MGTDFFYGVLIMNELIGSKQETTMSSFTLREIINAARVEHGESKVENNHLLKRIEDELEGELEGSKSFRHPQSGVEVRYYDLTKEQCLLVGMRESKAVRRKVLEKLKEQERNLRVNAQTKIDRQYARLESPELTSALKAQREAKGKEITAHIFSNDYNMMNRIVLGFTSANFRKEHEIDKVEAIRDYLSPVQTEAMLKIQRINTSLIEIGMDYKDRKEKLQQYFNDNFKDKMIEEVLRLES